MSCIAHISVFCGESGEFRSFARCIASIRATIEVEQVKYASGRRGGVAAYAIGHAGFLAFGPSPPIHAQIAVRARSAGTTSKSAVISDSVSIAPAPSRAVSMRWVSSGSPVSPLASTEAKTTIKMPRPSEPPS